MWPSRRPARPEVILDHLRPVSVLLNHDRPEEEIRIATEQEAARTELILVHIRPVGALLGHDDPKEVGRVAAEQEAVLPEVNVDHLWPVGSLPLFYSLSTLYYIEF